MRTGTLALMMCVMAVLAVVLGAPGGASADPIVIDTVTVGSPGNSADPATGYGAVAYTYAIGKYELTTAQYVAFLNAVAKTDTYGLYNTKMTNNSGPNSVQGCQIQRSGSSGSYTYSVDANHANRPVNYISWGDAARFCNWLYNGQPTGAQDLSTTEDGSYYLNGANTNAALQAVVRKADATWVIPTENEWYKAAYHKNDGATGNYWLYPTCSNSTPSNALADPTHSGNHATFYATVAPNWTDATYTFTEVGAHTYSAGAYGTFDQGGNVAEWTEGIVATDNRALRGGAMRNYATKLASTYREGIAPTAEDLYDYSSLRVAMVCFNLGTITAQSNKSSTWADTEMWIDAVVPDGSHAVLLNSATSHVEVADNALAYSLDVTLGSVTVDSGKTLGVNLDTFIRGNDTVYGTLNLTGKLATATLQQSGGQVNLDGTTGDLINDTAVVTVSGGTFDLKTHSETVGAVTVTGGEIKNGTLTGSSYAVSGGTISAGLAGSGVALTKFGTGSADLTGTNSYSGATTIQSGALYAVDGAGLPTNSTLKLEGGVLESSGTFGRTLGTASGNVCWTASTSGGFAARDGELHVAIHVVGYSDWLTWTYANFLSNGQMLILGSATANNVVDIQNPIDFLGAVRTIQVNDNPNSTGDSARLSGQLCNGGLNKTGAGVLEIASTMNDYTSGTTVSAGTLRVTGKIGDVLVKAGGKLGGNGQVGSVTVGEDGGAPGAIVAPGNSPGTLNVEGDYTMNNGSIYEWQLLAAGIAGIDYDTIAVTGNLTLNSTWTLEILKDAGFSGSIASTDTFDLFTYTGSLTTGLSGDELTSVSIVLGAGLAGQGWNIGNAKVKYEEIIGGKRVYLTGLQVGSGGGAVPEPAALGLIGLVFLSFRRRNAQRAFKGKEARMKRQTRVLMLLVLVLAMALGAPGGASADTAAIQSVTGGSTYSTSNYRPRGWQFSVNTPVYVSALGLFDANGSDTLTADAVVTLFAEGGAQKAQATVTTSANLINHFFWITLPQQVYLAVGTYRIANPSGSASATEPVRYGCTNTYGGSEITYLSACYGLSGSYPTTLDPAAPGGYVGANFKYLLPGTVVTATTAGGTWTSGSSWVDGTVPGLGNTASISNAASNVQVAANVSAYALEVTNGTVTFDSGKTLTVGAVALGDGTNNGTITGSGGTVTSTAGFAMKSGTVGATLAGSGIALNKTTAGIVTLSNANTYSGATSVSAGTLLLSGSGSINSSSGITINGTGAKLITTSSTAITAPITLTSGTLGGTGTIGTAVTVGANGILSPGLSPGTQDYSAGLTWNGGGSELFEINDVDAGAGFNPGWDLITVSGGAMTIGATPSSKFNILLTSLKLDDTAGHVHDFSSSASYAWMILDAASAISGFTGSDQFNVNTAAFSNGFTGSFSVVLGTSVGGDNTELYLKYTAAGGGGAVPEPAALGLIGLVLLAIRRRKASLRA